MGWAALVANTEPDLDLGFAVPNGAYLAGTPKQRAAQWARLKKAGAKTGVSDLFWPVPRQGYHGLWIEMKADGRTASSESQDQRDWRAAMSAQGYRAELCFGAEQAIAVLQGYFGLEP